MAGDILFRTDEFIFSFRVGGILRREDSVLLQCPAGTREYAVIGGHISAMETAAEALAREYREELHANVEVVELLCVGENFFQWGSRPCHQICFFYDVRLLDDSIPQSGTFHGYDDMGNERMDLDFSWISVQDIENGLRVYPQEITPYLLNKGTNNGYFLSKEL